MGVGGTSRANLVHIGHTRTEYGYVHIGGQSRANYGHMGVGGTSRANLAHIGPTRTGQSMNTWVWVEQAGQT